MGLKMGRRNLLKLGAAALTVVGTNIFTKSANANSKSKDNMMDERTKKTNAIAEIIKLKNTYIHYNDSGFQAQKIGELFIENGVWDGGVFGRYEGRQKIIDFFSNLSGGVPFSCHLISNEIIDVNGDKADGRWRLLLIANLIGEDGVVGSRWYIGDYKDVFVKKNGVWMFESLNVFWNLDVKQGDDWSNQGKIRLEGTNL